MLLANYASDSDSDGSGPSSPPPAPAPAPKPAPAKKKKPVKIALDLPRKDKVKSKSPEPDADADAGAAPSGDKPPPKRKLGGAGSSALLGMLPPPKRKLPATGIKAGTLGSGTSKPSAPLAFRTARPPAPTDDDDDDGPAFVPTAVKRKADANLDLFGLSDAAAKPAPTLPKATPKPATISSAPPVSEFVPPAPSPADPYPGYYQLPSGSWAAHDPATYAAAAAAFPSNELAAEEGRKAARPGRDWAALDDGRADVLEINANAGLAEGRAEAARRERLARPKTDEFEYKAVGQTKGLAQERHQLSSLLSSAYAQRDELEARIQENKKNMRNAQMKYGF